jgi:hypothetical protein
MVLYHKVQSTAHQTLNFRLGIALILMQVYIEFQVRRVEDRTAITANIV